MAKFEPSIRTSTRVAFIIGLVQIVAVGVCLWFRAWAQAVTSTGVFILIAYQWWNIRIYLADEARYKAIADEVRKRIKDGQGRNCPFYGQHLIWFGREFDRAIPKLIMRGGRVSNQCAIVFGSHAPCYMETEGSLVDWRECKRVAEMRK